MNAWKTISLREETYQRLKDLKIEDETFNDIVEKLVSDMEIKRIMFELPKKIAEVKEAYETGLKKEYEESIKNEEMGYDDILGSLNDLMDS